MKNFNGKEKQCCGSGPIISGSESGFWKFVLATSPDILNESENLQTNFVLQFDYPKNVLPLRVKSTLAVYNLDPEKKLKAYSDFFQDLFNQLALKHNLDVEAFKVTPLEQIFVQFSYTKPMSLNSDRFSIKMLFGRNTWKQLEFFDEPHLEWNLLAVLRLHH